MKKTLLLFLLLFVHRIEQILQCSFNLFAVIVWLQFLFHSKKLAHCNTPPTFDPHPTLRYASSSRTLSGVHLCSDVPFFLLVFYSCWFFWYTLFFFLTTTATATITTTITITEIIARTSVQVSVQSIGTNSFFRFFSLCSSICSKFLFPSFIFTSKHGDTQT